MHQYVGVAWEIFRMSNLPLDFPRPIDIYTKADGVPGYVSYLVLVLEYDITITVNAAGERHRILPLNFSRLSPLH